MTDLLLDLDDNKVAYTTYLEAMYQGIRGYSVKNGLNVTPNTGLQLSIASGVVSNKGTDINYAGGSVTIDTAETDRDRIDIIVYDFSDDTIKTLKGIRWVTDGVTTNIPLSERVSTTQIPLAIITVLENATVINSTEIEQILFDNFYNTLGTLLPFESGTQDLGSASLKWNKLYAKSIDISDTNITSTTTNDIVLNDNTIDYGTDKKIVVDKGIKNGKMEEIILFFG